MVELDSRQFREALGCYATGVAVVTTRDPAGHPVAMTVNSFAAVSLDPPLVLWSVQRGVGPFPAFETARHYAVHVLHADQEALARHFARDIEDKFQGMTTTCGIAELPLLEDYAALFQCCVEQRHPGGDHLILVGRVLSHDQRQREPLLFHAGRFRSITG